MKVKNLEFNTKPSPEIRALGNQTLTCSAYGNVEKMSGKWSFADGTRMDYISYRNGNIFTIKANVKKTGTYICSIKSEQEEIQTITRFDIFSCKLAPQLYISF